MDLCSTHHVSTSCSWNHHACICFNAAHRLSIVTVVKRTLRCERHVWHCPGATFRVSVGHTGCSVVWLPPSSQSAPTLASTLERYLATSSLPLTCSKVRPALPRAEPSAGSGRLPDPRFSFSGQFRYLLSNVFLNPVRINMTSPALGSHQTDFFPS